MLIAVAAIRQMIPGSRIFAAVALASCLIIVMGFVETDFAKGVAQGAPSLPFAINDSSLTERWASIEGGIKLFFAHPIFGAGLGAFMKSQVQSTGALVIHSSPVWILAEMGLVGLLAFGAFGVRLITVALADKDERSATLLLVLIGFCAMAAPHDMMYQRSVWLIAGAILVVGKYVSETTAGQSSTSTG
jgi:O-antigen ligase